MTREEQRKIKEQKGYLKEKSKEYALKNLRESLTKKAF